MHSLEPVETPSNSASNQAPNYAQRSQIYQNSSKRFGAVAVRLWLFFQFTYVQYCACILYWKVTKMYVRFNLVLNLIWSQNFNDSIFSIDRIAMAVFNSKLLFINTFNSILNLVCMRRIVFQLCWKGACATSLECQRAITCKFINPFITLVELT